MNSIVWARLFHAKCGKRMLVCVHELVKWSLNQPDGPIWMSPMWPMAPFQMMPMGAMVPVGSARCARWAEWVPWDGSRGANDDKRGNCMGLEGSAVAHGAHAPHHVSSTTWDLFG